MNGIQRAIAQVTGVAEQYDGMVTAVEAINSQNQLLQRQIEDIDYLNIFDMSGVQDILPGYNSPEARGNTLRRLRRMRHENPFAKQGINLKLRFTLGRGVQYAVTPEAGSDPSGGAVPDQTPDSSEPNLSRITQTESLGYKTFRQIQEALLTTEANDQIATVLADAWNDPENQMAFTSSAAMTQWFDDVLTDGERWFLAVTADGAPHVKLTDIPLEEIKHTIYHPDNRLIPVYYKRVWVPQTYDASNETYAPDGPVGTEKITYYLDYRITKVMLAAIGGRIKIPAEKLAPDGYKIMPTMRNVIRTRVGVRGVSELYASREWFRVYKDFLEQRAAINAAATAIAWKRKVQGGPTAVAQFQGRLGDIKTGWDNPELGANPVTRLSKPGAASTYTGNPAVDLEWAKADTGALNAKEDGHALLVGAGAGMGVNSHYFGEGGDANLATAQAMELPMVKSFEDDQHWVAGQIREFFWLVLTTSMPDNPTKVQEALNRVAFTFSPIISQDVVKWMTGWNMLVTGIAPGNEAVLEEAIKGAMSTLGVTNIDRLMPVIRAEQDRIATEKKTQQAAFATSLAQKPLTGGAAGTAPGTKGMQGGTPVHTLPSDTAAAMNGKVQDRHGPTPAATAH